MREHRPQGLTPSLELLDKVWLYGVAVVLILWAVPAVAMSRSLDIVGQEKLLALFVLFLCGWTGGWLWRRRSGRPGQSGVVDH